MIAQAAEPVGNALLAAALDYARRGFSVIPLQAREKRPRIKWEAYQTRPAAADEIRGWWQRWPDANVGIVTGAVSGLVVLDVDGEEGRQSLTTLPEFDRSPSPVVTTGKGSQIYFRHIGEQVRNFARKLPGLDLRGDGGYVVAPPSIHPNGRTYAFFPGFELDKALSEPPPSLLQLIRGPREQTSAQVLDFSQAPAQRPTAAPLTRYVTEAVDREVGRVTAADDGTRNDTLNKAAFSLGQLVGAGQVSRGEVERRLFQAATRAGLAEMEARRTIESGLTDGMAQPRDLSGVGPGVERERAVTFSSGGAVAALVPVGQPAALPATRQEQPAALDIGGFRLDRLTEGEPPPRRWLVRGALPLDVVSVLFGPGGVGKSMVVLDLGVKVATRQAFGPIGDPVSFLGPVTPDAAGAAIYITLEDDTAEIHRRADAIDPHRARGGAPFYVFAGLDIPGFDPTLVRQEGKAAVLTSFAIEGLERMIEAVVANAGAPVRFVALDPAGDLLNGSEDDAAVVKPLMRRLREVASKYDCSILLVGHTGKGQLDGDKVGERGMRGSSAWIANSRAAFGLWRPDTEGAASILKRLDMTVTPENIERVVMGRMVKSNAPTALTGLRRYLQDPKSGLLIDVTDGLREKSRNDAAVALDLLVAAIKEAAELRLPYQVDGQAGLYKRRHELPPPLNSYGQKRLREIGNAALEARQVEKCRAAGSAAPCWLDVPGGPFATGVESRAGYGSLAEARKAAQRSAA
jgi:hypothetical protein